MIGRQNVLQKTDIEEVNEKAPSAKRGKPNQMSEFQSIAYTLLQGKPCALVGGDIFPHKIAVCRDSEEANPAMYIIGPERVARPISIERLASMISDHTQKYTGWFERFRIEYQKAVPCVKFYSLVIPPVPRFLSVCWKSDPRIALHRMSYDPDMSVDDSNIEAKAPHFHEIMTRISLNRQAFVQRVGSLFDENAPRKQALWIWGPADAGKSMLQWLMTQLIGENGSVHLNSSTLKSPYWIASIVGKRLACVSEASASFIETEQFKSITGDDMHEVNQKFRMARQEKIISIFSFFSNEAPTVPPRGEFRNRIINVRIEALQHRRPQAIVQIELMKELPAIAGYCLNQWQSVVDRARIGVDEPNSNESYEEKNYDILDVLDAVYIITNNPNDRVLAEEVRQALSQRGVSISATTLKNLMENVGVNMGRPRHSARPGARRPFYFAGLRMRSDGERQVYSYKD